MGYGAYIRDRRVAMLAIAKEHGAVSVRIFGSYARGEEKQLSDIDLIVEMEPGRSLVDIIAIKHDLEDLVHKKVDVVTENALSPYIREEILQEAIAL